MEDFLYPEKFWPNAKILSQKLDQRGDKKSPDIGCWLILSKIDALNSL